MLYTESIFELFTLSPV